MKAVTYPRYEKIAPVVEQSSLRGRDFGDIIEVVIILAVLVAGLFYTAYGLFN